MKNTVKTWKVGYAKTALMSLVENVSLSLEYLKHLAVSEREWVYCQIVAWLSIWILSLASSMDLGKIT